MENIIFTEEEYIKMENEAKRLLGWSLQEKTGMTIKAMMENPELAKQRISAAKGTAGFVDRIKLGKLLDYLESPDWKQILKDKLS